ncbi:G-type lectin S-receptor-like serine/threonine-protein kinase At2g19130 [Ananas comosus]|uniref:Receptor-like serine/threonine-protein kinase n=2 Tax=Ananas comosus TaxID=4615 RepID=A0A6P5FI79_ANACO|nr:G-type lectin S-receptor-like serine/threonine-protein kinase At2g19130 [Ananas comosus]
MNSEEPKLLFLLASVFVFCCCNLRAVVALRDTITAGNPLAGNQSIVSKNGDFELRVPTPDDIYILGLTIWCRKYNLGLTVWSAYIDSTVVTIADLQLSISDDGNLILLSKDGSLIWSTNVTSPAASNSTVAVLLDSGNLVLRDGLNASNVLWQSFDHPSDTWLPGAPLGFDRSTGNHIFLTSYYFSLDVETVGSPQFVLQTNGSGEYDHSVQHLAVPTVIDIHQDSQKGTFSFHGIDGYTIFFLDINGLNRYKWSENPPVGLLIQKYPFYSCGVGFYCGPFGICDTASMQCICPAGFLPTNPQSWEGGDYSSGCRRVIPLNCKNENSSYMVYFLKRFPDNPQSFPANDYEGCESACTSNCSCTAFSFRFDCKLWHGDLINSTQCDYCSDGWSISIRTEIDSRRRNKHPERPPIGLTLGVVLGTATVLAVGLIVTWRCKKRSRTTDPIYLKSFRVFFYSDLKSATKNFSKKLGQGSFGSVFMGTLRDSTLVAVKKLEGLRQGEKQFRAEVITVGMIQHINIVRLLGFCAEGTRRLLVYEFVTNGSLDSHLFSKTNSDTFLDWNQRYRIAIGIARGLAYLHEKCKDFIIHCDIKPENILLDEKFCPRIADFGMAKLFTRDGSRVLTTMRGTIGYLAPEWISGLAITHKADVYSFGMMLFEIISGRRNTERSEDGTYVYFPTWAAAKIHEGEVACLLDNNLKGEAYSEELERACRVACWCIQELESSRPAMGLVVQMLEGVQEVNIPPIPTYLCNFVWDENGSNDTQVRGHCLDDLMSDSFTE